MLEVMIFSKDRACQLELLLRSIKRELADWRDVQITVLYTYSSLPFRASYDVVIRAHPEFRFLCERDLPYGFREATLANFGQRPYVMFLVDDDVFKAPFQVDTEEFKTFAEDESVVCLSLRMAPGMDYVYTLDRHVSVPEFGEGTVWDWTSSEGDWAYPMSLDGHIFRTAELHPLMSELEFHNPNSLEFALAQRPLPNPRMVCFADAKVLNLPVNRVQETAPNRHGSDDARWLNAQFLRRRRLSLHTVAGARTRSPHCELPLRWEAWDGLDGSIPAWAPALAAVEAFAVGLPGADRVRRVARRVRR